MVLLEEHLVEKSFIYPSPTASCFPQSYAIFKNKLKADHSFTYIRISASVEHSLILSFPFHTPPMFSGILLQKFDVSTFLPFSNLSPSQVPPQNSPKNTCLHYDYHYLKSTLTLLDNCKNLFSHFPPSTLIASSLLSI